MPAGAASRASASAASARRSRDLQALAGLLERRATSLPPELARQLGDAARELLIALRALIDWWIARLEREPEPPVEVQDIPIERQTRVYAATWILTGSPENYEATASAASR